jgi:copper chaperone
MLRFRVEGMTCQGCVNAVRQAVAAVAPGQAVTVTLATGEVEVTGEAGAPAIAGAIERAGFLVAEQPGR